MPAMTWELVHERHSQPELTVRAGRPPGVSALCRLTYQKLKRIDDLIEDGHYGKHLRYLVTHSASRLARDESLDLTTANNQVKATGAPTTTRQAVHCKYSRSPIATT